MNSSASPAKISTTSWPSSARNACSIASTPTLNIRPRPRNGARVVEVLKARAPVAAPAQLATSGAVNDIHTSPYTKEAPLTATCRSTRKSPAAIQKKMYAISKLTSVIPVCATSRAMRWASGTRTILSW
jgi:hypothetical protein